MKLFYQSGTCALAPHIILNELSLQFELIEVNLKTKQLASGHDFCQVNPKGVVPVLEMPNGELLTENAVILQFLADLKPEARLIPGNQTLARYRCLELVNFITTELHKGFGLLFHADAYANNPEAKEFLVNARKEEVKKKLGYISEQLGNQDWLMGHQLTIADAYLFVILNWAPHMKIELSPWRNLERFVTRMKERPAVLKTLKEENLN